MTRKLFVWTWIALLGWALWPAGWACQPTDTNQDGGTADSAPTEQANQRLSLEDARAAFAGLEVLQPLAATLESFAPATRRSAALEFGGKPQLPEGFGVLRQGLTDAQMKSITDALQKQLDQATQSKGCAKVEKVDKNNFKVTFTQCAFGSTQKLTLDGSIACAVSTNRVRREITITVTFTSLTVSGRKIEGSLKVTTTLKDSNSLTIATDGQLKVTTKEGKVAEVSLNGTLVLTGSTDTEMTLNATGTIKYDGKTYDTTFSDVKVRVGEGAPYAGSVKLVYQAGARKVTVEVIFSEETVKSGAVEVKVNGRSMGTMTADELLKLLKG